MYTWSNLCSLVLRNWRLSRDKPRLMTRTNNRVTSPRSLAGKVNTLISCSVITHETFRKYRSLSSDRFTELDCFTCYLECRCVRLCTINRLRALDSHPNNARKVLQGCLAKWFISVVTNFTNSFKDITLYLPIDDNALRP